MKKIDITVNDLQENKISKSERFQNLGNNGTVKKNNDSFHRRNEWVQI